jgi:hypothetical protein
VNDCYRHIRQPLGVSEKRRYGLFAAGRKAVNPAACATHEPPVTGFAWSAPKRYDQHSIATRREISLPHHPWHRKCYYLREGQRHFLQPSKGDAIPSMGFKVEACVPAIKTN